MIYKKYFILFCAFIMCLLSFIFKDNNITPLFKNILKRLKKEEFFQKDNNKCDVLDPIYIFAHRFKKYPNLICKNEISEHICYTSSKYDDYNKLYRFPYGTICNIKNFILDPLQSFQSNIKYKGPIDDIYGGSAILYKGFFKM